ncbi:MAG: DUF481 domain-containing protein [Chitinophagales bacterium]
MLKIYVHLVIIVFLLFTGNLILNAQIINIEDRRLQIEDETTQDSVKWLGRIGLAFSWTQNKSKIFRMDGNAQFERLVKKHLLLSITDYSFAKFDENRFINQGFQHFRYNYRIRNRLTYEALFQIQTNKLANIDLRVLTGTGLRFRLYQKGKGNGFYGVTYLYEYEEESLEQLTHQNHRLSTYFSFEWLPVENITISSTTYYQPLFTDFSDYRITTQSNVVLPISKQFNFTVAISYIYDSHPAKGAPDRLYNFVNGLRFNF